MFKITVIAFLLVATITQTFNREFIVINFLANQKYIAHNLCENRDKPQLNCCGKCQLKKKLNQENKKEGQLPSRKSMEDVIFYSEVSSKAIDPHYISSIRNIYHPVLLNSQIYFDIFHPPQA